jgi:hypothetical protein
MAYIYLSEHPWYVRTQKINKQFEEETKWHKRIYLDFKCLYVYLRYRKERIDYSKKIKDSRNLDLPASS